ncbi:MAG: type II toxin-antitoxin system Phd/YefM family antitoxin [Candidatus Dormibacteraceae bacterium]
MANTYFEQFRIDCSYNKIMDVVASTVGIRELKSKLSSYIAAVKDGQEVIVTERDKPVARISPLTGGADEQIAQLIAEGKLIPARSSIRWLPDRLVEVKGGSIVDLIRDQRR